MKEVKKEMEKRLKNITMGIVVFAALFGLIVPIQAPGVSFTIYGQVFDVNGVTPVNNVTVSVTNLETGSSVDPTVTANGGWYSVNLANLKPDPSHSPGDRIQIFADDGAGKTNITIVPRAATSPQRVNLTLEEKERIPPTITFIEPPTPAHGAEVNVDRVNVTVNVTDPSNVSVVLLNWNGKNNTMQNIAPNLYSLTMTNLLNGNYTFKVYANDTVGNMGVSETRIVRVNVTEYNFTISLTELYSIISLPVNDSSITKASSLATKIGANCTEIIKWDKTTQAYVSYIPGVPLNDFNTAGGEGYFVNLNNPTSVVFRGKGWEYSFTMSLVTGYNMIGIPVNDTSVTNASTLAAKIGANCTEIIKWDSAIQAYVSYIPGVPLNDFNTAGGEGYFVNLNNPTSVVFTGEAWRN